MRSSHMGGFPGSSDGKESACNAADLGPIPGSGRSLGERNGSPLQYSCLQTPTDRGTWRGYSPWGHRKESDMTEQLTLVTWRSSVTLTRAFRRNSRNKNLTEVDQERMEAQTTLSSFVISIVAQKQHVASPGPLHTLRWVPGVDTGRVHLGLDLAQKSCMLRPDFPVVPQGNSNISELEAVVQDLGQTLLGDVESGVSGCLRTQDVALIPGPTSAGQKLPALLRHTLCHSPAPQKIPNKACTRSSHWAPKFSLLN